MICYIRLLLYGSMVNKNSNMKELVLCFCTFNFFFIFLFFLEIQAGIPVLNWITMVIVIAYVYFTYRVVTY